MPKKTATTPSTAAQPATTQKGAAKKTDKKTEKKKGSNVRNLPLFEKRARDYSIGNAVQPRRDLTRFVRWPKYVRLQRQRRILLSRLKVPPPVNQFTKALDKATATQLFKLLNKYRPETKQAKKARLVTAAQAKAKGETAETKKALAVKYGINSVVQAIEQKKAKIVVIAHDVDPIELVVWLPALCRKMQVPYAVVKSKSRLGTLVHKKTASAIAVVDVNKDDKNELAQLAGVFTESYNKNVEHRRQWGGGRLGLKAVHIKQKRERAVAREQAMKNKAV